MTRYEFKTGRSKSRLATGGYMSWPYTKFIDHLRISNKVELKSEVLENLMNTVDLSPQPPKFYVLDEGVYRL